MIPEPTTTTRGDLAAAMADDSHILAVTNATVHDAQQSYLNFIFRSTTAKPDPIHQRRLLSLL
jgi:hypothetical protein